MTEKRYLTEEELLAALNVDADRTTLWRWRKQGMPYHKVGRHIRYDLEEVRAWLRQQEINLSRIADIATELLTNGGAEVVLNWQPTEFDRLQTRLHNTVMSRCPDLHPNYRIRIGSTLKHDGQVSVSVVVERVQEVATLRIILPPEKEV